MNVDIAIIGAGIAGASLGAELAPHRNVVLIEAEDTPGYHSTGRSAAFWHETLGGPLIQTLSLASLEALRDGGFLKPRVSLEVAEPDTVDRLDALEAQFVGTGIRMTRIDAEGVRRWIPRAKPCLVAGLVEEDCADIDVGGLHAQYLARFKRAGGQLLTGARVDTLKHQDGKWHVRSGDVEVVADVVVDAAGAWADGVAELAGVKPIGIQPKRRTIAQVRVDGDDVPDDLPLVMDIAGTYYFRPEGPNRLWLCPHDETPVDAHDVAPEEIDIAIAIDRFETVTSWRVVAVERKWAGLRSFSPDRLPVFGFDAEQPGFFWCAGQGGVGIQTSPAAAQMCAHLIVGAAVPLPPGVDPEKFSPRRFS